MCKDDKMLINNQIEERNETIKGLNDPIKLKKLDQILFFLYIKTKQL